jgi:hypothetical protein
MSCLEYWHSIFFLSLYTEYEPYPESTLFGEKMAAVDTSFIPSMNEAGDQNSGVIPECPSDYPSLLDFVWPTDEYDDAILACTTSTTLAPTTLAPTTTTPPVNTVTASPTVASTTEETTETTNTSEETAMPTTQPTEAGMTSQPPNTASDAKTTSQPVAPSGVESTDEPTTVPGTIKPTIPAEPTTTADVQESCSLNPSCAAQNGLRVAGIQSCCPTRDERNLYLDCCAAVADFCYDDTGSITVCRSVSTSQYLSEVITGQRDPNAPDTFESAIDGGSAAMKTCLLLPFFSLFLTGALMFMSILSETIST